MNHTLLLVDDDQHILEVLETRFTSSGYTVLKAGNGASALELLDKKTIDFVISDIKMPHMDGLELFEKIKSKSPLPPPVLFLTAFGNIPQAVDAVKAGAQDYVTKPFNGKDLVEKVNMYFSRDFSLPLQSPPPDFQENYVWGHTPLMIKLKSMVKKSAALDTTVLILGESGVGKEGIAKTIHDSSPRASEPFIVVDCGSTPAGILESELFGHKKGAFTNALEDKKGLIEAAENGTLFLDEIGNISAEMQHRLLRFLEEKTIRRVGDIREKKVNCRVIAATNSDLQAAIEQGSFRQDLYYRLRVICLKIPPLRKRQNDLETLASFFVKQHCNSFGFAPLTISVASMDILKKHTWPGNIRELKNCLEAAVVLCEGDTILPEHLQLESHSHRTREDSQPQFSLEQAEREALIRALRKCEGNITASAELLEISRRSIHYKVKKYAITEKEYR